jgi:hypothetical protein
MAGQVLVDAPKSVVALRSERQAMRTRALPKSGNQSRERFVDGAFDQQRIVVACDGEHQTSERFEYRGISSGRRPKVKIPTNSELARCLRDELW